MTNRVALVFVLVACMITALHLRAQAAGPRRVEVWLDKPECATARALDLPSSWKTPLKSGLTVWVCE
jgi:hypothetical protein